MRKFFRKTSIWLGAIFWSNRLKITSVISASFMLQAMSCTYGTDESYIPPNCDETPCYEGNPKDCQPTFDIQKKTDATYSQCEQSIIEQLSQAEEAKNKYGENSEAFESQWNSSLQAARDIADTCDMERLKGDGIVSSYACTDGTTVSVEEGEIAHTEYKRAND